MKCLECGDELREAHDDVMNVEVRGCLKCRYAILTSPDGCEKRISLPGPLERMVIDRYRDHGEK